MSLEKLENPQIIPADVYRNVLFSTCVRSPKTDFTFFTAQFTKSVLPKRAMDGAIVLSLLRSNAMVSH